MGARKKSMLTWVIQILIIAALLGFVLFVFYGSTGAGSKGVFSGKKKKSVLADAHVNGERPLFALFTPSSTGNAGDPSIRYTKHQIEKVREAAQRAGMAIGLFAPKTGVTNDYLKEIRVFKKNGIVQLLFPHFGLMESDHPIPPEPDATGTKNITLSIGPAKQVTFKHGGFHLYFHLKQIYIVMDSAKIDKHSRFERVADSLVPITALQPS